MKLKKTRFFLSLSTITIAIYSLLISMSLMLRIWAFEVIIQYPYVEKEAYIQAEKDFHFYGTILEFLFNHWYLLIVILTFLFLFFCVEWRKTNERKINS